MSADVAGIILPEPGDGEAIFVIHVGSTRTQCRVVASNITPKRAIKLAADVLQAEWDQIDACPFHGEKMGQAA